jgi:hypothetical protein
MPAVPVATVLGIALESEIMPSIVEANRPMGLRPAYALISLQPDVEPEKKRRIKGQW